jgi:acetylglutamate kinase
MSVRETVLQSLSAVGAQHEAKFYAELFARQDAETFAMIVLDPRCLKEPLLEALISALRILSNLQLSPTLVVGALEDGRTSAKFQSQRLARDLDKSGVRALKLNTASYGLIQEVQKTARAGKMPVLEMTDRRGKMNLSALVTALQPKKIIFLQPSGGLSDDRRTPGLYGNGNIFCRANPVSRLRHRSGEISDRPAQLCDGLAAELAR